jgi:hypothetical protein
VVCKNLYHYCSYSYVLLILTKGVLVSCGFAHARGIGPHARNFTLRMIRGFEFQFSTGCLTVLKIVSTIQQTNKPPDSKMGTEVMGMITHADALHRRKAAFPPEMCEDA